MDSDLEKTVRDIRKNFGQESLVLLGDSSIPQVDVISTGSLTLDLALGVGGLPRGRISEIYGPDSSGKTTICQHVIAKAQAQGLTCAFIDMEHALDLSYAANCGIDVRSLLFSQPDYGEQALAIAERLIKSGQVSVIVIDSVAALVPRAELEGDIGDSFMGIQARMMSAVLRRLSGDIKKHNCILLFANQIRHKIGTFYGNPETTSGGMALKFYASVRLDIRRIQTLKSGSEPQGIKVRVRVVKNKVAAPLREAEFDIRYGRGIDQLGEIIDLGVRFNVIARRGSFYSWGETRLGQGRENSLNFLQSEVEIQEQIRSEISEFVHKDSLVLSVKGEDENAVSDM